MKAVLGLVTDADVWQFPENYALHIEYYKNTILTCSLQLSRHSITYGFAAIINFKNYI
jgi:hypothetical protein